MSTFYIWFGLAKIDQGEIKGGWVWIKKMKAKIPLNLQFHTIISEVCQECCVLDFFCIILRNMIVEYYHILFWIWNKY